MRTLSSIMASTLTLFCASCAEMGSSPLLQMPSISLPVPGSGVDLLRCGTDSVKETWQAKSEVPSVEVSLDRINTAARMLEVDQFMLQGLPIAGSSKWPREVNGSMPPDAEHKLNQAVRQDPLYAPGSGYALSPMKVKALYLQSVLFNTYPDLYYTRQSRTKPPTEEEVRGIGNKILGAGYNPMFNKVFYRLLVYNAAFEPKRTIFTGDLNGKATEFYPTIMDAVFSLADNKKDLIQMREAVLQADEKRAKARRDIEETAARIRQLRSEQFGEPATAEEAETVNEQDGRAKEIDGLNAQFAVQQQEYEQTMYESKAALQQMSGEIRKIKSQATAFTPEQQVLAMNIQSTVDAVRGSICGTEVLIAITASQLPRATPKVKEELNRLKKAGVIAIPRMKRIYVNSAALPMNLAVLKNELIMADEETKLYDGLFKDRVNVQTTKAP